MTFVGFDFYHGRLIAILDDVAAVDGELRLDRNNLELRIANLRQQAPDCDLSVESAVLAEMNEREALAKATNEQPATATRTFVASGG